MLSLHGTCCGRDVGLTCAQGTQKKSRPMVKKIKKEKIQKKSSQKKQKGKWCRVPPPVRQHPPLQGGLDDLMVLIQSTWGVKKMVQGSSTSQAV